LTGDLGAARVKTESAMKRQTGRSTVSAVIPTHNRSAALRRALDSVFAQTRPADEVVVVDDGSLDDTPAWIPRDFPDVTYIRQDNAGVSAARNRGVASCRSEWIAFLDSDDEWRPKKLELQIEALAANPGYPVCHTNEIWIRDGRRVNEGRRHAKSGGWIFQMCLSLCVISPSSAVIRRSLLCELGGFDETLPVCEDYDLWLRICARHPVLFLEEPLTVKYGGHADQLSRRFWGMDRFRIRAIDKILSENILCPGDRAAAVAVLLEKTGVYLEGARKRGKVGEVREYDAIRKRYRGDSQMDPAG
jgi:glycosyltransferase involved in cell wall biosynthesis